MMLNLLLFLPYVIALIAGLFIGFKIRDSQYAQKLVVEPKIVIVEKTLQNSMPKMVLTLTHEAQTHTPKTDFYTGIKNKISFGQKNINEEEIMRYGEEPRT